MLELIGPTFHRRMLKHGFFVINTIFTVQWLRFVPFATYYYFSLDCNKHFHLGIHHKDLLTDSVLSSINKFDII